MIKAFYPNAAGYGFLAFEDLWPKKGDFDFKCRELDCVMIRYTHELAADMGMRFDTVRAAF